MGGDVVLRRSNSFRVFSAPVSCVACSLLLLRNRCRPLPPEISIPGGRGGRCRGTRNELQRRSPSVPHSLRIRRHPPHSWSSLPRGVAPLRSIAGRLRRIFSALRSGVGHLRRILGPRFLGVVASDSEATDAGRKADEARSGANGTNPTRSRPRRICNAAELAPVVPGLSLRRDTRKARSLKLKADEADSLRSGPPSSAEAPLGLRGSRWPKQSLSLQSASQECQASLSRRGKSQSPPGLWIARG